MASTSTIQLKEVAKDMSVTTKDLSAKLSEFGINAPRPASFLTNEEAGAVIDIYTTEHMISAEELEEKVEEVRKKQNALAEKQAKEEKAAEEAAKKAAEEAARKAAEEKKAAEEAARKAAEEKKAAEEAAKKAAAEKKAAEEAAR